MIKIDEQERIEQIKNRIREPKEPALSISRIPKNTLDRFLEICSIEDFCDDRGMCLRQLVLDHDELEKIKRLLYGEQCDTLEEEEAQDDKESV